jgi:hypothetical protein
MSEWWTYTLSDLLMFSAKTYYRLFELYNHAIWPAQLVAGAIGVAMLACVARSGAAAGRAACGLLAVCWLWVAWAFHAERYATISSAGIQFAVGFAVEALLLLWLGTVRGKLTLAPVRGAIGRASLGLLLFGMLGYPVLASLSGRPWRQIEFFGVAPDPTVVATLGVLAITERTPWLLLPIPLLWCAISGATLWTMRAPDAAVAPVAALLALLLACSSFWRRHRPG